MDLIFLWLMTVLLGYWIFKKFKEFKNLPPGPWGLPILGYLPFLNKIQPHMTMTKLSKQYGPIYGLGMGNVYAVVLSDQKLIREALSKDAFAGRAPLWLTHGIMHGNGIICAEGPLWKDQRKLIATWLKSFGTSKHGMSRERLEQRIALSAQKLKEMLPKTTGSPIDLTCILNQIIGNIVNEIVFGFEFPPGDKTYTWFRQIQEEGCHEMSVAGALNFLPFLRFFSTSMQKTIHILKSGQDQTHRLYGSIVARRRRLLGLTLPKGAEYPSLDNFFKEHPKGHIKCITYSKNAKHNDEHYFDPEVLIVKEGESILENFLLEQKSRFENGEETSKYMKDEQLMYLLADMFGAGLDTTSATTSWIFLFLALHQEEQDLIRKEILHVYPKEGSINYMMLPKTMAAICESQRLRSIVPIGIPHGCLETTYIGNYRIPKGTMVIPLQWAVHMDPAIWTDPNNFRPSRFLASDGTLLKPKEFMPFQTGKRMCPGDELSRMLVTCLVAQVLRRYRVKLSSPPPTHQEMQGNVGITLTPPHVLYSLEPICSNF